MKNKTFKYLIFIILILIAIYFFVISSFNSNKLSYVKDLLSNEQRYIIKKYIFPYNTILELEKNFEYQKKIYENKLKEYNYLSSTVISFPIEYIVDAELEFKLSKKNIKLKKESKQKIYKKKFEKFRLLDGFYAGIANKIPGSGYIDFHNKNLFVLSSRGILVYGSKIEDGKELIQIENNINDFIGVDQFKKSLSFSIKDLLIKDDKIFISFTEEMKEDCWNTSIIYGEINYKKIIFKNFFSPSKCISSYKNLDNEFEPHQSGGRIIDFSKNNILFSLGEYRSRFLAQDKNSVNGNIIKINIDTKQYENVSIGHRNPQGLYFDKLNNFILETEHGPMGGDEINLINLNNFEENLPNFGWPISSQGEHYGGKQTINDKKYKKYPLYKSHKKYEFIEPLISFVPSIGISEISKIKNNNYVVGSLKDKSLYFFELSENNKLINLEKVKLHERIRDLLVKDDKIYLFLEDTASIAILSDF
jgi:hypothetical protein